MTSLKSVAFGLAAGLIAYALAANVGIFHHSGNAEAESVASDVTASPAPSASEVPGGAKLVPQGAKNSGTKLALSAKNLAPSLAPLGTTLAPLAPRQTVTATPTPIQARISTPTPTLTPSHTPTPTRSVTPTPRISVMPTPSPSLAPSPTPTPTPTPTPIPSTLPPSPTPPAGTGRIVINEVAWSGTAASPTDEWIELFNAGTAEVELSGWSLQTASGSMAVKLIDIHGSIAPGAYFLIERTDDATVSDILADLKGSFGGSGISNTYERLWLQNSQGTVIDEVAQCADSKGSAKWCGGTASPGYASMERMHADNPGSDPSNWASNSGLVTTGLDGANNPVRGTPKYKNSVSDD